MVTVWCIEILETFEKNDSSHINTLKYAEARVNTVQVHPML